jgi:Domain of unknown function (DUF4193)
MDPHARGGLPIRHNLRLGDGIGAALTWVNTVDSAWTATGRFAEFIGPHTRSHGCRYHGYELRAGTKMATDYDAPRKTDEDAGEESIEELKTRRHDKNSGKVDEDEAEAAESFELPGADLSHEELAVRVLPRQADEFTCSSCFLVHHRSQLAADKNGQLICRDCAA